MKFPQPVPVRELAAQLNAELIGETELIALGMNEIHHVQPGDVTFVDVEKYFDKALKSAASIIILNKRIDAPTGKTLLYCADPFQTYNNLALHYRPFLPVTAAVSDTADIGEGTVVEPNTIIGHHVRIGQNCYISANVIIGDHTVIGDNVLIQPGAIIGTDAFYFKKTAAGFVKWRSCGRVVIEDDAEIGAGCTINKGVSSDTVIGAGTKLDCKVHVGHDVRIGKRCLIAAQTGIGGNTVIGDDVVLYGQVGIAQNLTIGDKVVVSAKAGVSKDLDAGKSYFGLPAGEARKMYRELAALRLLPEFFAQYYK
ncbi:MAG: UDP-3-O-(3-hydroxymyristoyl)glucosamine N-acyltransferase [Saprospiraceae bacterium]|nr:UDP-3-O-(3-hydroxymyristoyl)glucosamine N-acyltransferase [Saprospiraceae bacterium]